MVFEVVIIIFTLGAFTPKLPIFKPVYFQSQTKENWFENFQTKEKCEPQHIHVQYCAKAMSANFFVLANFRRKFARKFERNFMVFKAIFR